MSACALTPAGWPFFMDADTAAAYFSMSRAAFYRLGIPPIRPFGRESERRWRRIDLEAWGMALPADPPKEGSTVTRKAEQDRADQVAMDVISRARKGRG